VYHRWTTGAIRIGVLAAVLAGATVVDAASFRRVSTFPALLNSDIAEQSVAEIVAASEDGKTLIYTDSAGERIGFVDITHPRAPLPGGTLAVGGSPTSVAAVGPQALVAVDTSSSFAAPSGLLRVVDIATRTIVAPHDLGGQPDSVAVSPDRRYAAVAIENQRDEDAGDGRPPQSPPGFVVIVDLVGTPAQWTTRVVSLVGVADTDGRDLAVCQWRSGTIRNTGCLGAIRASTSSGASAPTPSKNWLTSQAHSRR
jgi:DNA-binding beta-propeller fold protein YncE